MKRQSCHNIETSQLICKANQLPGFYMIMASVMKELTNAFTARLTVYATTTFGHSKNAYQMKLTIKINSQAEFT